MDGTWGFLFFKVSYTYLRLFYHHESCVAFDLYNTNYILWRMIGIFVENKSQYMIRQTALIISLVFSRIIISCNGWFFLFWLISMIWKSRDHFDEMDIRTRALLSNFMVLSAHERLGGILITVHVQGPSHENIRFSIGRGAQTLVV